jgi:hypothetical protein
MAATIQQLYDDFDIDDLSLADFTMELQQEFEMARDAVPTLLINP